MPGFDNWPTPPAPPEPTSGPEYDYSDEEEAEEREEEEVEIEQVVEPAIQLGGSLMVIDPNTGTKQTLPWVRPNPECDLVTGVVGMFLSPLVHHGSA